MAGRGRRNLRILLHDRIAGIRAQNADPAKGNLQLYYRNIRQFIPFWFKIGLRHPACYLDGMLANTMEMWFP